VAPAPWLEVLSLGARLRGDERIYQKAFEVKGHFKLRVSNGSDDMHI
jgi:hypothetical protein